ncbi:MAG: YqgE/AlgH family protein [Verrucomicrobiota bacterium]
MYDETKKDDEDVGLAGSLLLAHPDLKDPNFAKSVVLMTAHEDEGSLGVVINSDTGLKLGDVSEEFKNSGLGDVPLYVGGPVAQDQIILAGWKVDEDVGEFKLYFGLEPLVAQSKRETEDGLVLRAFKGYSGWGKDQLVGELKDNAWVVSDMDGQAITELHGDSLWKHIIMEINPELGLMAMAPEELEDN